MTIRALYTHTRKYSSWTSGARCSKPHPAPYCRVLPTVEFNAMILFILKVSWQQL